MFCVHLENIRLAGSQGVETKRSRLWLWASLSILLFRDLLCFSYFLSVSLSLIYSFLCSWNLTQCSSLLSRLKARHNFLDTWQFLCLNSDNRFQHKSICAGAENWILSIISFCFGKITQPFFFLIISIDPLAGDLIPHLAVPETRLRVFLFLCCGLQIIGYCFRSCKIISLKTCQTPRQWFQLARRNLSWNWDNWSSWTCVYIWLHFYSFH